MKVQPEMCHDCPWRHDPSNPHGPSNKFIRETSLMDINKIHICHNTGEPRNRRCRGSYLWRKKQFKMGAVRFEGKAQILR